MIAKAVKYTLSVALLCGSVNIALADSAPAVVAGAKQEGKLVSYGMSDDWVNLGTIFSEIERNMASSMLIPT